MFLDQFLNMAVLEKYMPMILKGAGVTVILSLLIVVAGISIGAALACARAFHVRLLSFLIVVFADVFRAMPPLVVILLVYFGLPNLGVILSSFTVLFLVLTLILAAFAEEIVWAGITSTPKGQWEAARSTGMTFAQTLGFVVLPHALRMVIPPLTNRAIAITKMTALGMVIGVPDILGQATTAQSFSANATPLTLAAIAYVVLFLPFVIASRWLEQRFALKGG